MFVLVLLSITLCPFKLCNHLEEEERAGCFAVIVLRMSCYCNVTDKIGHKSLYESSHLILFTKQEVL